MKKIYFIFKREFLDYFYNSLGYIIIVIFLLLNGILFWSIINILNNPEITYGAVLKLFFGNNIYFWFFVLIFIPIITMKLFSNEIQSGTVEMLMTSPVKEYELILGKFFAAFFFYVFMWIPTIIYPIIIYYHKKIDLGPIFTGYLGVILIGTLFISIGLFCSSISKTQISSAILTFFILVMFLLISLTKNFANGIIPIQKIIFLFSTIITILFLNIEFLKLRKWV